MRRGRDAGTNIQIFAREMGMPPPNFSPGKFAAKARARRAQILRARILFARAGLFFKPLDVGLHKGKKIVDFAWGEWGDFIGQKTRARVFAIRV